MAEERMKILTMPPPAPQSEIVKHLEALLGLARSGDVVLLATAVKYANRTSHSWWPGDVDASTMVGLIERLKYDLLRELDEVDDEGDIGA